MDKISSNRVIKVGIVTEDVENTYAKFCELFDTLEPYESHSEPEGDWAPLKYQKYKGEPAGAMPMKVKCVYLDPIYFEIVQPMGDAKSPWHDHLREHGTSVCFISLYINGFEQHIDMMGKKGFPLIFEEEKGYERYAYFDTLKTLGFTLEMKERTPKQ
ncbi:VOC family protein [Eubacteriales bacterium OttesenSCG-928-N13]|nr:VOC family protein [Eubacteriales bacterium OttesenSCG-928-N13]